ncbi:MAG: hypothetical protein FWD71_01380 [Oscillospiraceae bacterium]|nr:hypothetical protein [Oscillospiraceae bacterium]
MARKGNSVNDVILSNLIKKYKLHQGFAAEDKSFDDVILFNIESSIKYIVNAGVSEKQITNGDADFAIIRGASDMWDGDRFSRLFFMAVTQIRGGDYKA